MIEVGLLVVAGVLMLWRPGGSAIWIGPVMCVVVGFATTLLSPSAATSALGPLRDSLLFLVFAVPLAVGLDEIGVFSSIAARFGHDAHLVARLWWLAAGVVAVFNLDAAVVLLTPLYVRIARRHGLPAEALAFQPVLLACLSSGVLPVSNLTNLIVADRWDLTAA
ncbi:MAG: SLC13 family permease, partial [Ilumatobacter sp.]